MLKNVGDGSLEVVLRGAGALLSNLEITIVDAAVIDTAESLRACVLGNEDRRLGRDCSVGESNELMMRIKQDIFFRAVGRFMLTHSFGGLCDVGIHKPKHDVLRGELVFEPLHLRNVAIGDGAVGCDKKENYGLGARRSKTGNRLAIQVVTVG
jgi:hypothetical protein